MAKAKTVWYCTNCGNEYPQFLGRCPACGEWNTLKEMTTDPKGSSAGKSSKRANESKPQKLKEIDFSNEDRTSLGLSEVNRLLGGGIVKGSLVLIGGEPGIGKSTLSLQIPLSCPGLNTLYVSGEESARQVKMRSTRLSGSPCENGASADTCGDNIRIYTETLIDNVIAEASSNKPDLMIVDSVQTMHTDSIDSTPGSVSQIKEVAAMLLRFAKESGVPVVLIGHITKDGYIAGPKILEHIVDVVLQFEGESRGSYRILRSIKNRFASTAEIAVFEMTGEGLREVKNPSEMLIPMHEAGLSGTAICASLSGGSRPLLFEVQALVSSAVYGTAQRSATGFDTRRLNMLLAVLEKRAGFHLGQKDVFLNMAGGLKVTEPAADLAVVAAVLSSNFDFALPPDICFAGEVGLSGEIRPCPQTPRRMAEAARLGFKKIYVSSYEKLPAPEKATSPANEASGAPNIVAVRVSDIADLVKKIFK